MNADRPHRRLYGRSQGHKLSPRLQTLVEDKLPELDWPDEGTIDPVTLLPNCAAHELEIGFGASEHLIGQAKANPNTGYLGIEPFLNGVAKAVRGIVENDLFNVRVKRADARDELGRMPDAAFDRIFLLFPDPWPKTRHAKRRFVQPDTAQMLARLLKPKGTLRVATDVRVYADWALPIFLDTQGLSWTAQSADAWRRPPSDHITTRYQTKHLGDTDPVFMEFERV